MVVAMRHFSPYLQGKRFLAHTDHASHTWLLCNGAAFSSLTGWCTGGGLTPRVKGDLLQLLGPLVPRLQVLKIAHGLLGVGHYGNAKNRDVDGTWSCMSCDTCTAQKGATQHRHATCQQYLPGH